VLYGTIVGSAVDGFIGGYTIITIMPFFTTGWRPELVELKLNLSDSKTFAHFAHQSFPRALKAWNAVL
jgi:hypothetical protein